MREIQGNLIDLAKRGEFDVIVHGCNCFHIMGGGIAKPIREQFPAAYGSDCCTIRGSIHKLGSFSFAHIPMYKLTVVNAYTQYHPGHDFRLQAYKDAMKQISIVFSQLRIGMPLIGCGIAGADWKDLRPILADIFDGSGSPSKSNAKLTVVHYGI